MPRIAMLFWMALSILQFPHSMFATEVAVYFGNGVWNPRRVDAEQSTRHLEEALRMRLQNEPQIDSSQITFDTAWNQGVGNSADVFEAALQLTGLDNESLWLLLAAELHDVPLGAPFQAEAKLALQAVFAEAAERSFEANRDLTRQVDAYAASAAQGKRVVIVSHSQGNLFANRAYQELLPFERQATRIISVATPDSTVAGAGPYTTSKQDAVIRSLPTSLPWNLDNCIGVSDSQCYGFILNGSDLGHGFVGGYIAPNLPTRLKILDDIVSFLPDTSGQPSILGRLNVMLTYVFNRFNYGVFEINIMTPTGGIKRPPGDQVNVFSATDLECTSCAAKWKVFSISEDALTRGAYRVYINQNSGNSAKLARFVVEADTLYRREVFSFDDISQRFAYHPIIGSVPSAHIADIEVSTGEHGVGIQIQRPQVQPDIGNLSLPTSVYEPPPAPCGGGGQGSVRLKQATPDAEAQGFDLVHLMQWSGYRHQNVYLRKPERLHSDMLSIRVASCAESPMGVNYFQIRVYLKVRNGLRSLEIGKKYPVRGTGPRPYTGFEPEIADQPLRDGYPVGTVVSYDEAGRSWQSVNGGTVRVEAVEGPYIALSLRDIPMTAASGFAHGSFVLDADLQLSSNYLSVLGNFTEGGDVPE